MQSTFDNLFQAQTADTTSYSSLSATDSVETYFACITTCSIDDGECVTSCTEILREHT